MSRFGLETLLAYADGELGAEERAEVERALAEDPALRAELEAQDRNRYPPFVRLFLGGTTTWREYCARPIAASPACSGPTPG